MKIVQTIQKRYLTLISLLIIIPIGFASKFYSGPAASWVNDSLGGFFYVIFWIIFFYLIFPKSSLKLISGSVLFGTSILEFCQLWHNAFLDWIRSFFLGRTLIGTSFNWSDFLYYILGAILGWGWLLILRKYEKLTEQ